MDENYRYHPVKYLEVRTDIWLPRYHIYSVEKVTITPTAAVAVAILQSTVALAFSHPTSTNLKRYCKRKYLFNS